MMYLDLWEMVNATSWMEFTIKKIKYLDGIKIKGVRECINTSFIKIQSLAFICVLSLKHHFWLNFLHINL